MAHLMPSLGLLLLLVIEAGPQEPPRAPGITGVVAPGTPVELVKAGFQFTEGPVGTPDGGLYFTDIRANVIYRLDPSGGQRGQVRS